MTEATEPRPTSVPAAPAAPTIEPPGVAVSWSTPAADPPEPVAPAAGRDGRWHTLWLTDRDVAVFAVLAAVLLSLLVVRWVRLSDWGAEPIEIERLTPLEHEYRLDLNAATWVELAQLPNVGETLGVRIVEDRAANGPFRTVDDLDRVKGIGPKTLDRLRPFVTVSPPE